MRHVRERREVCRVGNLTEMDHLEHLVVDGRIILKYILKIGTEG